MKRIVLSFALLVIAQSGKPSVIEYRLQEPSFAATENAPFQERGRGNGTYTKDSWTVFYRGYEVEGASPSSFEDLGSGYGKDAWKVFYQGLGIEGASPSSFRSFGDGYAKDDWQVFYRGRKIENASSSSFENLGGGYGKDSWTVFYRGKPIPNASASSFEKTPGKFFTTGKPSKGPPRLPFGLRTKDNNRYDRKEISDQQ